jgi:hypothetical protein
MRKRLLAWVAVAILFFYPFTVHAQEPEDTPTPVITEQDMEVAILQAQLDTMRSYQQDLIETVYWSLAGIATALVVLVGYSWFTNNRNYDRERAAFREEQEAALAKGLQQLSNDLQAEVNKLEVHLQTEVRNLRKVNEQAIEVLSTSLRADVTQDLGSIRQRIGTIELSRLVEIAKQHRTESRVSWVSINSTMQVIERAISLGNNQVIANHIAEAREILLANRKGANEYNLYLFSDDPSNYRQILSKVPDQFKVEAEEVQRLLSELPLRSFMG